jgi:hypothetical protein
MGESPDKSDTLQQIPRTWRKPRIITRHSADELKEDTFSQHRKNEKQNKTGDFLVLIRDRSRYFCSNNAENILNEITHRRRAGAFVVHY